MKKIILEVMQREGGFVNHPDDLGGPTNFGVTFEVYKRFYPNASIEDLKNMRFEEAYAIYASEYYMKPKIDRLEYYSSAITEKVLDCGVNMGPSIAIKFLQESLNLFNMVGSNKIYDELIVDGDIGNKTLSALGEFLKARGQNGENVLLKTLNCLQGNRYISITKSRPQNKSFIYGWMNTRIF